MSKQQGKRKITVELSKAKDLASRPSVFERLGTKKSASGKKTTEHCRQWAQHGNCAYGKSCKFASTHTLISPSKQRAANKDSEQKRSVKDDAKSRLHSTVVVRSGRGSPDGEIDSWDQNDLEYADTDVLEKRRQQLQRELELQLKMDSGKDMRKDKKKPLSSSSSSRSSSSTSVSSSTSDGSSSSSSSGRDTRRKIKKGKLKRNSSSSSDGDVPAKKKNLKTDSVKRDKSEPKRTIKKDDKNLKKQEVTKKKSVTKGLAKKSLSPGKKSGGTPPITSKSISKSSVKHGKSPVKRNRSMSPHSAKDRDKKDNNKDRDKEKRRSRSPRKAKSKSPRRLESHSKETRRKESVDRSRPVSPKKQIRRDVSAERHRKRSASRDRDRGRDHKERSSERRKEKHDEKERHDRKERGRDRNKDKRDDSKRRGRERGLGSRVSDKGLEKPNKPMERLLPRPEERLAALAAITNRTLDTDKIAIHSKDRQDTHSERGGRKDRNERERSNKRDRIGSIDREPGDYDIERQYDRSRVIEHYESTDRYNDNRDGEDRSPEYRDRHYDPGYDLSGPPRAYDEEDRMYSEHIGERRDIGYDERRPHHDHAWEGRSGSIDRERGFIHQHKDWENDEYRGGEWNRDRHWPMHESQMNEWCDKEGDIEGWHPRGHPGPHRGRGGLDYGRNTRIDHGRDATKRRGARIEPEVSKESPPQTSTNVPVVPSAPPKVEVDTDEKVIPDDLSEISDDPDDILNRDDMIDHNLDDDSQTAQTADEGASRPDGSEKESTQDTSGAVDERDTDLKDEEDATNLDFEEISDGELEEERTRAGLGSALGVDWASLVAEARRREQAAPRGAARERWRAARLLPALGLAPHAHPVPAIQVAMEKRKRQRAVLFGSGCEITRALSARRDLALRRYLCNLPTTERSGQSRVTPQPALFHAARALLMQTPVTG